MGGLEENLKRGGENMEGQVRLDKQQKAIVNRMAKIIGHTKSIRNMVEDGRDCSEVLIQLSAVKAALNNTGKEILKQYLKDSLKEAVEKHDQKKIIELNRTIETFMK